MARSNGYGKKLAPSYEGPRDDTEIERIEREPRGYKEDECLNNYYYRKQSPTPNQVVGDGDEEIQSSDDSFAESRNYDDGGGFINYKKWERYGGK